MQRRVSTVTETLKSELFPHIDVTTLSPVGAVPPRRVFRPSRRPGPSAQNTGHGGSGGRAGPGFHVSGTRGAGRDASGAGSRLRSPSTSQRLPQSPGGTNPHGPEAPAPCCSGRREPLTGAGTTRAVPRGERSAGSSGTRRPQQRRRPAPGGATHRPPVPPLGKPSRPRAAVLPLRRGFAPPRGAAGARGGLGGGPRGALRAGSAPRALARRPSAASPRRALSRDSPTQPAPGPAARARKREPGPAAHAWLRLPAPPAQSRGRADGAARGEPAAVPREAWLGPRGRCPLRGGPARRPFSACGAS